MALTLYHNDMSVCAQKVRFTLAEKGLERDEGTELYLGVVGNDGVEPTKQRIAAASKVVGDFGIATECGIGRGCNPEGVREVLRTHAAALQA